MSVSGTGHTSTSLEAFLDSTRSPTSPQSGYASRLRLTVCGFAYTPPHTLTPTIHSAAWLLHCVTPSLEPHIRPHDINNQYVQRTHRSYPRWLVSVLYHGRGYTGTRISTGYPSTTPVGLALGPDSPWEDELDPGTLSHPAGRILTFQFVTHACILTRTHSTPPYGNASTHARRSPTQ